MHTTWTSRALDATLRALEHPQSDGRVFDLYSFVACRHARALVRRFRAEAAARDIDALHEHEEFDLEKEDA